jgi:hypothetical protein
LVQISYYFPFTGHCLAKPELISKLEEGFEPWGVAEATEQCLPGQSMLLGKNQQDVSSSAISHMSMFSPALVKPALDWVG